MPGGRVFAFTDLLSTTGRLVPTYWLAEMGYTLDQFFRKHIFTYSHDRAVLAVAEGLVDGAAMENLVYRAMVRRDPALVDRVRVIRKSEPFGTPPFRRVALATNTKGWTKTLVLFS